MPRPIRMKSTTNSYHIMIRGVNKVNIFFDDEDRKKFLQITKHYLEKLGIELFAYCLMDNHVHFLLRAKENFQKFMQCIQTVYAAYFNKKYERVGHLFQDRFKSIPVESNNYILQCVRYIHQNPVKANISTIDKYKWSSYKEYIKKPIIVKTEFILNMLGTNLADSINNYREYMNIIQKNNDIKNIAIEDKMNDEEATKFIEVLFKIDDVKEVSNKQKHEILKKVVELNIFSIRQISRIMKIDRNIIRRM